MADKSRVLEFVVTSTWTEHVRWFIGCPGLNFAKL